MRIAGGILGEDSSRFAVRLSCSDSARKSIKICDARLDDPVVAELHRVVRFLRRSASRDDDSPSDTEISCSRRGERAEIDDS